MKKIKSKIFAGVASLFVVILILSVLGIFFINRIAQGFQGTIKDNYRSVDYTMNMLKDLDAIYEYSSRKVGQASGNDSSETENETKMNLNISEFEENLSLEGRNITEIGEAELVAELRQNFKLFLVLAENIVKRKPLTGKEDLNELRTFYDQSREVIFDIYKLNINAVLKRNSEAESTAEQVTIYMAISGSISILITMFFIFSFPGKIVSPITELTNKIKSISERDYEQKLNVTSDDEMGSLARAFNSMVQRLKEYEETNLDKLLFENRRMDAIVQNLQDAVLILDENKKIVMVNNSVLKLTGLKEEEIINKYAPDIAARNDLVRLMISSLMAAPDVVLPQEMKPIKIFVEGKDNYYSIENIVIDIKSSGNGVTKLAGHIIILKNITRFQERDAAKTNLIATVSHELKTPLSSINLSLKLLEDSRIGDVNEEQKNIIKSIRHQSIRLSKVVNELLDYSQAETGNIKLKITNVRPEDIVELAVVALTMLLAEKNIQIETFLPPNLSIVRADLEKSVWVLVNILNNAIRYSPSNNKIIISATEEKGFVSFSVKDFGPGISKEDCTKIFEKFVQVGRTKSAGTGLGLAIAKEFVQSQNGDIRVESKIGEGSEFSFSLPVSNY